MLEFQGTLLLSSLSVSISRKRRKMRKCDFFPMLFNNINTLEDFLKRCCTHLTKKKKNGNWSLKTTLQKCRVKENFIMVVMEN